LRRTVCRDVERLLFEHRDAEPNSRPNRPRAAAWAVRAEAARMSGRRDRLGTTEDDRHVGHLRPDHRSHRERVQIELLPEPHLAGLMVVDMHR
jgi:hypothetical protein